MRRLDPPIIHFEYGHYVFSEDGAGRFVCSHVGVCFGPCSIKKITDPLSELSLDQRFAFERCLKHEEVKARLSPYLISVLSSPLAVLLIVAVTAFIVYVLRMVLLVLRTS
jgi:hypothetical protein